MVTKRRFLIMTVMMFVLLFMFQFSQVMKENGNEYDENQYVSATELSADDTWEMLQDSANETKYAVLIGKRESAIGKHIAWWCTYTKRTLLVYNRLSDCPDNQLRGAQLVLLVSAYIDYDQDVETLISLAKDGVSQMFCDLPAASVIEGNQELRELLGIEEVRAEQVELDGVNLFSGFLLGGQAIYRAESEEEKKERQDLDLYVPWYLTGNGCKTYMVGMLSDQEVKNEQLPALIWRASVGAGKVFAVNGDYMSESTGIGLLDAVMTELKSYEIYPVINAQNLAVANFPGLAAENTEKMKQLYSRDQIAVFRDILWPGLCSMIERNKLKMTCYLSPQFDYTDKNEPQEEQLIFYLKQMKEKRAEAGLTSEYVKGSSLKDKLSRDDEFFDKTGSRYHYNAIYIPSCQILEVEELANTERYGKMQTIVSNDLGKDPVVSYKTNSMTLQSVTSTGISHTYSEDLRMKSLQTALGYSNVVWDLNQISWPEKAEERWEILFEKFSSNIDTYWKKFDMFDKTTASESDRRIRNFLALDFKEEREGDTIHLQIEKNQEEVWFILRTHGEEIISVTGGRYENIEEDAYLIGTSKEKLAIKIKEKGSLYYTVE